MHRVSWEDDYQNRLNPQLMTSLLHRSVPVLKHCDWKVLEVTEGGCVSLLPLAEATTNQNGTHQGALIALSADYTGGVALTSVLCGVPVQGVHCTNPEGAASMWLAEMRFRYHNPSTGHLYGRCTMSDKDLRTARRRYFDGKTCSVKLVVEFDSNQLKVATAEMTFFAKKAELINQSAAHQLCKSARMIAALRSGGAVGDRILRVDRPHDAIAAGPHGELLAEKVRAALPQLPVMIDARTRHLDRAIEQYSPRQVVMLGAGLDMRPLRYSARLKSRGIRTFELDLPAMIEERQRVMEMMRVPEPPLRHSIVANLKESDIVSLLNQFEEFDSHLPTFFIIEGLSMYFSEEENRRLLSSVAQLMRNDDSRVWIDLVSKEVGFGDTGNARIQQFLQTMEGMGEKFVFGTDDPNPLLQSSGLVMIDRVFCGQYVGSTDPVQKEYQFVVAAR